MSNRAPDGSPRAAPGGGPSATPDVAALGAQVRRTRQRTGLSVEDLAGRAGVSAGSISQLERGQGNPAFHTLTRLAQALGLPLVALLREAQDRAEPVVRADRRTRLPDVGGDDDGTPRLRRELLTPGLNLPLQVIRTVMPPRFSNETRPFRHLGLESVHVVSGRLLVVLADTRYELDAGDSITYETTHSHWWANLADTETVVIGSVSVVVG